MKARVLSGLVILILALVVFALAVPVVTGAKESYRQQQDHAAEQLYYYGQ